MEPDQALHRALDQIERIAGGVGPDALERPTPCADFDVRALLNHTTASLHGLGDAASGRTWDMGTYSRDLLGGDPIGSFTTAVQSLRSATSSDDVLERTWSMPFGDTPGRQAIAIAIMEVAQHGWDLARATDQDIAFDEELAETALALAKANMPPDDQRPEGAFGPPVAVPADAAAADRLAGFMGRTP